MTRRQIGRLAAGVAAAIGTARAVAQTPDAQAQTPAAPATDWLVAARQSKRDAAQELAQFSLEMSVEPAFRFKA